MEPIGSIYTEVSDDFQKGIIVGGIFRCVKAEKHDLGVVMADVKIIGQMDNTIDHTFESANRVYDVGGVAPTMNTCGGGGLQPKILEANSIHMVRTEQGKALRKQYENHEINHGFNEHREPELRKDGVTNTLSTVQKDNYICVAMRGRNPTNPSDRTPGIELEQTLEVNGNGTTNCLTSVQKDNLVLEKPVQLGFLDSGTGKHQSNTVYDEKSLCPNITTIDGGGTQQIKIATDVINKVGQISNDGSQYGTVIADNGLSPNLVAGTHGYANSCIATQYRIRKLTPRECWRLMDFSDEDFEKAAEVNSNTQLYKQSGNSIVVNVLVAILGQLLPGKENVYKELSE